SISFGFLLGSRRIPQSERKAVFLALVQAQDGGMDAARSREDVAGRFSVSQEQVKRIEKEGIEAERPPLRQCRHRHGLPILKGGTAVAPRNSDETPEAWSPLEERTCSN